MNSSGANNANKEHGDIGRYCPNAIPSAVRPCWSHLASLVDLLDKLIDFACNTSVTPAKLTQNQPQADKNH